jgi:hypothetical protein
LLLLCKPKIQKVVTEKKKPAETTSSIANANTNNALRRLKSDLVLARKASNVSDVVDSGETQQQQPEEQCCPICLKDYQVDEEIAFSPNSNCSHAFHRECIEEWLLRHEECPCCRYNYLDSSRVPPAPEITITNNNNNNNNNEEGRTTTNLFSPDGDFLEMLASIERMYREAHGRIFSQNNAGTGRPARENNDNGEVDDDSEDREQQLRQEGHSENNADGEISPGQTLFTSSTSTSTSTQQDLTQESASSNESLANEPIDLEQGQALEIPSSQQP